MLSPIDLKRRILLKGKVKHVLRPEQYAVKRTVSTMLNKLSSFNGPERSKGSSRSTMGVNVRHLLGGWRGSATCRSLLAGSSLRESNNQSSAQPSSRACSLRPDSARGSDLNDISIVRRLVSLPPQPTRKATKITWHSAALHRLHPRRADCTRKKRCAQKSTVLPDTTAHSGICEAEAVRGRFGAESVKRG